MLQLVMLAQNNSRKYGLLCRTSICGHDLRRGVEYGGDHQCSFFLKRFGVDCFVTRGPELTHG